MEARQFQNKSGFPPKALPLAKDGISRKKKAFFATIFAFTGYMMCFICRQQLPGA